MNDRKKSLIKITTASLLSLCMLASPIVIGAETINTNGGSASQDVTATYVAGTSQYAGGSAVQLRNDLSVRYTFNDLNATAKVTAGLKESGNPEITLADPYGEYIYTNVAPKMMTEKIYVDIYPDGDTENPSQGGYGKSIQEMLIENLETAKASDTALKTLCVDLLNYGEACQRYFDYNESNLATNFTAFSSYSGSATLDGSDFYSGGELNRLDNQGEYHWKSASLIIGNTISVICYFEKADSTPISDTDLINLKNNSSISFTSNSNPIEASDIVFGKKADNRCYVRFNGLNASTFGDMITFQLNDGTNSPSADLIYGIPTYLYNKLNDSAIVENPEKAEFVSLLQSIAKYATSAKNYDNSSK